MTHPFSDKPLPNQKSNQESHDSDNNFDDDHSFTVEGDYLESTVVLNQNAPSNEFDETQVILPEPQVDPDSSAHTTETEYHIADIAIGSPPLSLGIPVITSRADETFDEWIDDLDDESDILHPNPLSSTQRIRTSDSPQNTLETDQTASLSSLRDGQRYRTGGAGKRFRARVFDLAWQTLALLYATQYFVGSPKLEALATRANNLFRSVEWQVPWQLIVVPALLPIALILDSIFSALFGNTPGKALLGVKVLHKKHPLLSWWDLLRRNLALWAAGLGFGIPGVQLVSLGWQYSKLRKKQRTSYDQWLGLWVGVSKTGFFRKILAFLATILLILSATPMLLPASTLNPIFTGIKASVDRWSVASGVGPIFSKANQSTTDENGTAEILMPLTMDTAQTSESDTSNDNVSAESPETTDTVVGSAGIPTDEKTIDLVSEQVSLQPNTNAPQVESDISKSIVVESDVTANAIETEAPDSTIAAIEDLNTTSGELQTLPPPNTDIDNGQSGINVTNTEIPLTNAGTNSYDAWKNPITDFTTDIDSRWTYSQTNNTSAPQAISFSWNGARNIKVVIQPIKKSAESLDAVTQAYVDNKRTIVEFSGSGFQYNMGDRSIKELNGSLRLADTSIITQVAQVDSQYWVLEMQFDKDDVDARQHAEQLSATIWATF